MSKRRRNKQRRSHLKKYASDYIKTDRFDHAKIAAHSIFQNRARVRTTIGPRNASEPIQNNTFIDYVTHACTCPIHKNKPFYCKECECYSQVVSRASRIPETKTKRPRTYVDDDGTVVTVEKTPRQLAQETRHDVMQSERLTKVEEFKLFTSIYTLGNDYLRLYFTGNLYFFEEKHGEVIRQSCMYVGRERAMRYFNHDNILWVKVL